MKKQTVCVWVGVWLFFTVLTCSGMNGKGDKDDQALLSLERIFVNREFDPEPTIRVTWLEDGSAYTISEPSSRLKSGKDIVKIDPATGHRSVLVRAEQLVPPGSSDPLAVEDYSWSRDMRKLLVYTNSRRVWRRNTRGDYWVLDLEKGRLDRLGGEAEPSTLMFAKFSPQGDRVAYVHRNNIYVQDLETMRILKLTFDGSDTVINGTSDWVYEEEFGIRDGFRWSPDGRHIAFWQFDTSGVGVFRMINNTDFLYPRVITFR
ncbi:MAG: DPP IV N-terminal domain-containing protein, partial [Candidatus Aminicenantales bacterium]